MMNRAAGVLLPITSLPSRYGVGCFDRCAYEFVDYLKEAGQTFWQFLPPSDSLQIHRRTGQSSPRRIGTAGW